MNAAGLKKIVVIGAGKLAHHLAAVLIKKGHEIIQVVGRSEKATKEMGMKFFTSHTVNIKELNLNADIYIICVNDESIAPVAASLKLKNKLVLHTSGSIDIEVLKKTSAKYGVLYPLQTFTAGTKIKWSKTPLLIEANNAQARTALNQFASSLSKEVSVLDSNQRLKLHLAAVFACNFSNHLYTLSQQYLEAEGINLFHLLQPLIQQTAKKIKTINPSAAQTGPAVRKDKIIIEKHLKLLNKYKTHKEIYHLFSKSIQQLSIAEKGKQ